VSSGSWIPQHLYISFGMPGRSEAEEFSRSRLCLLVPLPV
jgi:hypothetical protein